MFDFKTRKPTTPEEIAFKDKCYTIGMQNGWCNGEFARQDGNFIVEEDRLNPNSFVVIDDPETLKKFFKSGNWCLGQGVIYQNLCFINQINGGDEWLTIKDFGNEIRKFESISWKLIIDRDLGEEFERYLDRLLKIKSVKEYYGRGD